MDYEFFMNAGIDAEDAIEKRFMGNMDFYIRMLKKFPDDPNFSSLINSIAARNNEDALKAAHTLKGTCGNMSIQTLYMQFTEQVTLMREGKWNEAYAMMPEITENYNKAVLAIKKLST